jgi:hypothetical protein
MGLKKRKLFVESDKGTQEGIWFLKIPGKMGKHVHN